MADIEPLPTTSATQPGFGTSLPAGRSSADASSRTSSAARPQPSQPANPGWALVGWLVVCYFVASLAALATAGDVHTWYARLAKSPLNPPDWVFAPVWFVLYTLMAVAAWLAWRTRDSNCRRRGLRLFLVQLFLNFSWTYVFFAAHRPGLALIEITLLTLAIVLTTQAFYRMSRLAGALMTLYLAWVLFAAYLNWSIWHLNS